MYMVSRSELELTKSIKPAEREGYAGYGRGAVAIGPEYSEITNGHFLIREYGERLPVADFPAGQPETIEMPGEVNARIVIPAECALEAAKQIPKKQTIPILMTALVGRQNGSVVLQSTDLESWNVKKAAAAESRWPETDKVFPAGEPAMTIGLSPDYLERLGKVFRDRGVTVIKVDLYGDGTGPVKLTGKTAAGHLEALLMPMQLDK